MSLEILKIFRTVLGGLLVVIGLVLSVPGVIGPGLLVILLGLVLVAKDHPRARAWVDKLKAKVKRQRSDG